MTNALKSRTLKQRLLSGSAWTLTGKAASVLAALIVNALLARLLSPQDFGAYFLAFSMVYLGATVGALGLNQLVVRFVAESMGLGQFGRVRCYGSTGVAVATAAGLGLQNILMWLGARAATGMWTHVDLARLFESKGTAGTG